LTNAEFIAEIAEKLNVKKSKATEIYTTIFETIGDALKSDSSFKTPIGTLKVAERAARAARVGRNPRTGESVTIAAKPAKKTVTFKPAKDYLEEIN